MIWPEVWPWVLAAVLARQRVARWVSRACFEAWKGRHEHGAYCRCGGCLGAWAARHDWTIAPVPGRPFRRPEEPGKDPGRKQAIQGDVS